MAELQENSKLAIDWVDYSPMQCDQASGCSCGRTGHSDSWKNDVVTGAKRPIAAVQRGGFNAQITNCDAGVEADGFAI